MSYNMGKVSWKEIGTNGFRVKIENERFSAACLGCRQNFKFGDFTSSLCRGPLTYLLKCVLHVQHDYYALLTNDIIVMGHCRNRSRRRFLGHVHTYPEIFFSANIFLRLRKFSRPHAAYSNRLQPSTCIRLYPEIFWFALVPSSFAGENPEMSIRIIAIWRHFFRAIATARCKQSKLVVYHPNKCLNLLKKSRKSMLIHINGPMMKLNYCWRSRK